MRRGSWLAIAGNLVLLAGVVALLIWSPVKLTVVAGNSMYPTYNSGDLVVSMKQAEYTVGDVLVFQPDEIADCSRCNVVHRIIDGDAGTGWVMQGDNNPNRDGFLATTENTQGAVIWHVSMVGIPGIFLKVWFWVTAGCVLVCLYLGYLGYRLWMDEPEE